MKIQFNEMIHYATLAPSGHNTQPWRFSVENDSILIYPDYSRRLPVVDPDDHALFISLGCALENLIIAANHMGYSARAEYSLGGERQDSIRVAFDKKRVEFDPGLFDAIPKRQATRSRYDGRPIPEEDMEALRQAGKQEDVSFVIFTGEKDIDPLIEFVKEGNRRQFRSKSFINELIKWIRFNKRDALRSRDGLNSASMGMPYIPSWLGRFILKTFATPEGEAKKCEKLIRGSSGLVLFVAETDDKKAWINVGRSFERVMLKAATLNIRHAHMNMPCEETEIRDRLRKHLGLKNAQPLLLLRIGYSNPMPGSYRRPVKDVLSEQSGYKAEEDQ